MLSGHASLADAGGRGRAAPTPENFHCPRMEKVWEARRWVPQTTRSSSNAWFEGEFASQVVLWGSASFLLTPSVQGHLHPVVHTTEVMQMTDPAPGRLPGPAPAPGRGPSPTRTAGSSPPAAGGTWRRCMRHPAGLPTSLTHPRGGVC